MYNLKGPGPNVINQIMQSLLMYSDWLKLVMWLEASNQIALFQLG